LKHLYKHSLPYNTLNENLNQMYKTKYVCQCVLNFVWYISCFGKYLVEKMHNLMAINYLFTSWNIDSIITTITVLAPNIIHSTSSEEFLKCNYEWTGFNLSILICVNFISFCFFAAWDEFQFLNSFPKFQNEQRVCNISLQKLKSTKFSVKKLPFKHN
jgi:hypothetical protein